MQNAAVLNKTPEDLLLTLPIKEKYELKGITHEIQSRLVGIKRDLFEIGKNLSNAKRKLPHGTFQLWIEQTFGQELPYSTANLYMKIYDFFYDRPKKSIEFVPLQLLMKMTQREFPEEILNLITDNAEHCDKLDVLAITEAYQAFKKKEISLGKFESIAKKQIELAMDIASGHTRRRVVKQARETLGYGVVEICTAIKRVSKRVRDMQFLLPPTDGSADEIQLEKKIDEVIQELEKLKGDIQNRSGFFRPTLSSNPLSGVVYDHGENSNN